MSAWAIVFCENDLWGFQEQGVTGRVTRGGYASKKAAIKAAASELGEDVLITVNEPESTPASSQNRGANDV